MTWETLVLIAGLIVLFTLLFDIFDIQPQVGSFAFIPTFTYLVFVVFRIVMGFAVASILSAAEPGLHPVILAVVAVVGNITFLQNLSLKVGGEQVAQLSSLFQKYKDKMVVDESQRHFKRYNARLLRVAAALTKAPLDYLEVRAREMRLGAEGGAEKANEKIQQHKTAAEAAKQGRPDPNDQKRQYRNYLASSYAWDIATGNLDYAEEIVRTRPWEQEGPAPARPSA